MERQARILLIGDSLTEWGYDHNRWVFQLMTYYSRYCDVICRGFGSWTSRWVREYFNKILGVESCEAQRLGDPFTQDEYPEVPLNSTLERPRAQSDPCHAPYHFVTLWLGSNDCTVRTCRRNRYYVPLEEFKDNMIDMALRALHKTDNLILITPGAVCEKTLIEHFGEDLAMTYANTEAYADCVRDEVFPAIRARVHDWNAARSQQFVANASSVPSKKLKTLDGRDHVTYVPRLGSEETRQHSEDSNKASVETLKLARQSAEWHDAWIRYSDDEASHVDQVEGGRSDGTSNTRFKRVACVDLFHLFADTSTDSRSDRGDPDENKIFWQNNAGVARYLCDGVHLSLAGERLFMGALHCILKRWDLYFWKARDSPTFPWGYDKEKLQGYDQ